MFLWIIWTLALILIIIICIRLSVPKQRPARVINCVFKERDLAIIRQLLNSKIGSCKELLKNSNNDQEKERLQSEVEQYNELRENIESCLK